MTLAGFEFIDLVGNLFFQIIGNPILSATIILGGLAIILAMFRAPLTAILVVLMPMLIGFVVNTAYSNAIEIPTWILILGGIIVAFLFASFFLWISRA